MSRLGRSIFDAAVVVVLASGAWMAVDGNWDAVVRFAVIAGFMVGRRKAICTARVHSRRSGWACQLSKR